MLNIVPTIKICTNCKVLRSLEDFWIDKNVPIGRHSHCKACMSEYHKKRRKKHGETVYGYFKLQYSRIKARAKKSKLEFTITIDDLVNIYVSQDGLCALTKKKLDHQMVGGKPLNRVSVDRIDSTKGYIKDNIQLVCDAVNTMKGSLSNLELKEICKLIIKNI